MMPPDISLSKEVGQPTIENNNIYNVFTEEEKEHQRSLSYDSGLNSSIEDDNEEDKKSTLDEFIELLPPKSESTEQKKKIKRIERSLIERLIIDIRAILSTLLSLPILVILVLFAIYHTTKSQILDLLYFRTKRPQDVFENIIPDEVITKDETYYAKKWGYESERHEVITEDGYIIIMYRIYKKGSNPRGKLDTY